MATLRTKSSSTPQRVPDDLATGEFAVNTTDGRMWVGDAAGNAQPIGWVTYIQPSTMIPAFAKDGAFWWQTDNKALFIRNGLVWEPAGLSVSSGGTLTGHLGVTRPVFTFPPEPPADVFRTSDSGAKTTGDVYIGRHLKAGRLQIDGEELREVPPGVIQMYAGTSEPSGWLFCNGQTLDPVSNPEYAALQDAIGRDYTASSVGADLFQVPDLRGLFPRFFNQTRNDQWKDPGRTTDSNSADYRVEHKSGTGIKGNLPGTLQFDQIQKHKHRTALTEFFSGEGGPGIPFLGDGTLPKSPRSVGTVGGEHRPNNVALWGIIKY